MTTAWQTAEANEGSPSDVRLLQHAVSTRYPTPPGEADVESITGPGERRQAMFGMAILLWAAGVLFLLVRGFHGWRSIVRLQQRLRPVRDDRLLAILPEVRRILDVKILPRLMIAPFDSGGTGRSFRDDRVCRGGNPITSSRTAGRSGRFETRRPTASRQPTGKGLPGEDRPIHTRI